MDKQISIHALLAESDIVGRAVYHTVHIFLSTLSLRRATWEHTTPPPGAWNFYPRSPCGERQVLGLPGWLRVLISIHALLAESDNIHIHTCQYFFNFYPRSPCGERQHQRKHKDGTQQFLSTLSLRRATKTIIILTKQLNHFYPRSPCGERLHYDNYNLHCVEISIHALLAESDSTSL